jgi:hypothetical protein
LEVAAHPRNALRELFLKVIAVHLIHDLNFSITYCENHSKEIGQKVTENLFRRKERRWKEKKKKKPCELSSHSLRFPELFSEIQTIYKP